MNQRQFAWLAMLLPTFLLAACGQEQGDTAPAGGATQAGRTPSLEGSRVFFITPTDGAVLSSPVRVEFGVSRMNVVPAGDDRPGSGHHHLIIDSPLPDLGLPVPADDRHVHYGDGRATAEIVLEPGPHTLQLLFADHLHVPHEPPVFSEQISVTVE